MRHGPASSATVRRARGFSLTELLVAAAIALVIMAAVAQLFSLFGRGLSDSQKTTELSGRLRTAAWQLRQDLSGLTVPPAPWVAPEANAGYLEILEGPQRDASRTVSSGGSVVPYAAYVIPGGTATDDLEADTDDAIMFTTRAASGVFTGRYGGGTIEAPCAEVAWFCRPAGSQPVAGTTLYNLYRRQLLVAGYAGSAPFFANGNSAPLALDTLTATSAFGQSRRTPLFDVSLRVEGGSTVVPNTLGDLSKRENRGFFAGGTASIRSGAFPYDVNTDDSYRLPQSATFDSTDRVYEDVILTNVIAFDVRVFDPSARTMISGTTTLYPGDPGYDPALAATSTPSSVGAFVDLGWRGTQPIASGPFLAGGFPNGSGTSILQYGGLRVARPTLNTTLRLTTYDTWSLHYEFNNKDDNVDNPEKTDEGANGLDDNGDLLPDNPAEYETSPPYPVPLRGLEIRIRCFEPTTRQVPTATIRHSLLQK